MQNPSVIHIRKYPNRRLYDTNASRAITHDDLYDMVVGGATVRVTDSKTESDITNVVLAQALLDRAPLKFEGFPPELFHFMIRAGDSMVRSALVQWFEWWLRAMTSTWQGGAAPFGPLGASMPQPPGTPPAPAPGTGQAPHASPINPMAWMNPADAMRAMSMWFPGAAFPGAAAPAGPQGKPGQHSPDAAHDGTPGPGDDQPAGDVDDMQRRIQELARELEQLKRTRQSE